MYLDQPGLMGLWDRIKAVFAGKSDVSKSEQKLSSKGLQLVANGTGITGDNTNFSRLTYDATKSSGMSAGSFTYAKGKRDTISTDDYVPLTTGRDYRISFDLMSDGGNATAYGCILFYDADKILIGAQNCMYIPGSTTKLARDLKKGDTEVYFESLDGWKVTDTRIFSRSIIFWDYANSFGYTYPPETYSRHYHNDLYADDSAVDKSAKKITLSKPWAFEEHKAGTPVSQNESGATFKYFGIVGAKVPTEWTTYEDILKGEVDYSGTNVPNTIPPGTAYARPGFLWNYNLSGDQLWMTNLSLGYIDPMTEDGVNASLEKLPAWSGYPLDNTQLIRRDNGGGGEWGRVTFLTVWNYIKGKADALFAPKSHTHQASDVSGIVADVRIHGASITADGVANIPLSSYKAPGVCRIGTGLLLNASTGAISVQDPADTYVNQRKPSQPVTCSKLDYAVKAAMCDGHGAAWTATEQAAARKRMGITEGGTGGGTASFSRFWFSRQAPGHDMETDGYFGFKMAFLACSESLNPTDNVQAGDTILWNGYAYFVEDTDGSEAVGATRFEFAPHKA